MARSKVVLKKIQLFYFCVYLTVPESDGQVLPGQMWLLLLAAVIKALRVGRLHVVVLTELGNSSLMRCSHAVFVLEYIHLVV